MEVRRGASPGRIVGEPHKIITTSNGASTWTRQTSNHAGNTLQGIACRDTTHCFTVDATGNVYATSNASTVGAR